MLVSEKLDLRIDRNISFEEASLRCTVYDNVTILKIQLQTHDYRGQITSPHDTFLFYHIEISQSILQ